MQSKQMFLARNTQHRHVESSLSGSPLRRRRDHRQGMGGIREIGRDAEQTYRGTTQLLLSKSATGGRLREYYSKSHRRRVNFSRKQKRPTAVPVLNLAIILLRSHPGCDTIFYE